MIEKNNIELLEEVEERVKKNFERKKQSFAYFGYRGKREEGYEDAVMSILSIIHEIKEKYKQQTWR